MPISGLAITLVDDVAAADRAVCDLRRDSRIDLGTRIGARLAATVETGDAEEDRQLWRRINESAGVARVDVVFISFDDAASAPRTGAVTQ